MVCYIIIQRWINNGKYQEQHRQDWTGKEHKSVIELRSPTVLSGVWDENSYYSSSSD